MCTCSRYRRTVSILQYSRWATAIPRTSSPSLADDGPVRRACSPVPAQRISRCHLPRIGHSGGAALVACSDSNDSGQSPAHQFLVRDRYFIAHRGAGDEAPEHTLAAYSRITDRGAEAISIAVHRTRDGILVCHQDPTLRRTSGQNIAIVDVTYDELSTHLVDLTRRVGPDWGLQPIPTFSEVLDRNRQACCSFCRIQESGSHRRRDRRAHRETTRRHHRLHTTVHCQRKRVIAREAGLAICTYVNSDAAGAEIDEAAERSDALGVLAGIHPPNEGQHTLLQSAVATGKPVIAWSVNRRSQLDYLSKTGVRGFMCSSWSYLAGPAEPSPHDTFSTGRIAPGDLAGSSSSSAAPEWEPNGSMLLAASAVPQSLSMGSMCPVRAAPYVITVEAQFGAAPPLDSDHLAVIIGRDDDSAYRLGKVVPGTGQGQLVVLRSSGVVELRSIPEDNALSTLQSAATGTSPIIGQWQTLRITVNPDSVTLEHNPGSETEHTTISAPRTAFGGYFTLARNYSGDNAQASFRNISIAYR